jgi:hypothetical protein
MLNKNFIYVTLDSVAALQVDQVASPTTPRDGLIIKPASIFFF